MSNYLVTLKPMEPYFFGGERTFGFGEKVNEEIVTYSNYFIKSEDLMSQTTLLGALRFLILKEKDKLNLSPSETDDLIGETSFSFEKGSQSFGNIENISPLFLIYNDKDYYIKTPFNHNMKNEIYTPFKVEKYSNLKTSIGVTAFPNKGEYDPKEGVANSFMNLSTGALSIYNEKICNESLFKPHIQTGIKKTLSGNKKDQDNSFFKKEYKTLNKDFKFAFFVKTKKVDDLPKKDMVILGQGKSLFEFSSEEKKDDLDVEIKKAFKNKIKSDESFYYAISDIFPNDSFYENKENKGFYIAEKKYFRNLNSDMSKDNYYEKLKKSKLYTLLKAGSVFYFDDDKDIKNENLEKIGFNKYIKIEGEKK